MSDRLGYIQNKIVSEEHASGIIEGWKLKGQRIVFTNGCFDILHKGHATYLAQAASLGNRLVVGLNTDDSIRRQGKGDDRPINNNDARALVLASIGFVDLVVFFDKDTPLDLITKLKPNVLVKGADYDPNERDKSSKKYIVGSDVVLANGGEVAAIPLVEGFSTTNLIAKVKG